MILTQMKKKLMALIMVLLTIPMTLLTGCNASQLNGVNEEKITEFYETVAASQACLDEVGDDIYRYWYDAIYKDKYGGSIDLAILMAQADNTENLDIIETNEPTIKSLYKEIRDCELETEIKAVMSAYTDYYELVVNVSGSFNSYSENKEKLKKELASALKDLALEV